MLCAADCIADAFWVAVPRLSKWGRVEFEDKLGIDTQMKQPSHETRVERLLGAPLADDAVRRWPQSGEILRGKARIAEVESHFKGLKLAVTRRHACGDVIVVEWNSDYGDGGIFRNVSIGELKDGKVTRVTDYWGESFPRPEWRRRLSDSEDVRPHADELTDE
jgi:hypothetical protein